MAETVEQIIRRLAIGGRATVLPSDRKDASALDAIRDFYRRELPNELASLYSTGAVEICGLELHHPELTLYSMFSFSKEHGKSLLPLAIGDESGCYIVNLSDEGPDSPVYYFGLGFDELPSPLCQSASIAEFLLELERRD